MGARCASSRLLADPVSDWSYARYQYPLLICHACPSESSITDPSWSVSSSMWAVVMVLLWC